MKGNLWEGECIIMSAEDSTKKINYFNPQKVPERLRDKVIQYQKDDVCKETLSSYILTALKTVPFPEKYRPLK